MQQSTVTPGAQGHHSYLLPPPVTFPRTYYCYHPHIRGRASIAIVIAIAIAATAIPPVVDMPQLLPLSFHVVVLLATTSSTTLVPLVPPYHTASGAPNLIAIDETMSASETPPLPLLRMQTEHSYPLLQLQLHPLHGYSPNPTLLSELMTTYIYSYGCYCYWLPAPST